MNRNPQGDKHPQHRIGMDSQSQSQQASGRSAGDTQGQQASRGASQQGAGRENAGTQASRDSQGRQQNR